MTSEQITIAKLFFDGNSYVKVKKLYPKLTPSQLQGISEMYIESKKMEESQLIRDGKFYEENLRPTSKWIDNFYKDHSDTIGGKAIITIGHKDLHYKKIT